MGFGGGTRLCPTCRARQIPKRSDQCGVCVSKVAVATKRGHAPYTCPKPGCGGTVRGNVCPDPRGMH